MQLQLALQQRQVVPDIAQLLLACISASQLSLSLYITHDSCGWFPPRTSHIHVSLCTLKRVLAQQCLSTALMPTPQLTLAMSGHHLQDLARKLLQHAALLCHLSADRCQLGMLP